MNGKRQIACILIIAGILMLLLLLPVRFWLAFVGLLLIAAAIMLLRCC